MLEYKMKRIRTGEIFIARVGMTTRHSGSRQARDGVTWPDVSKASIGNPETMFTELSIFKTYITHNCINFKRRETFTSFGTDVITFHVALCKCEDASGTMLLVIIR